MHCPVCGENLQGSICPRCEFDISLCRELYPTFTPEAAAGPALSSLRDAFYSELLQGRQRLADGQRELSELQQLQARTETEAETRQQKLLAAEAALAASQAEQSQSQDQLTQLQAELDRTRALQDRDRESLTALQAQLDTARTEQERTGKQAESLQAELDRIRQEKDRMTAQLQKQSESLRRTLEALNACRQEKSQVEQELREQKASQERLQTMLDRQQDMSNQEKTKLRTEANQLQKANSDLTQLVSRLQEQLKEDQNPRHFGWANLEGPSIRNVGGFQVCFSTNNTCEIMKALKMVPEVLEIPAMLEGSQVVAIRSKAFQGCSSLVELRLPDSLQNIGQEAFSDCRNLRTVSLPYGATVRSRAFQGCGALRAVIYPEKRGDSGRDGFIERDAFLNCHNALRLRALENSEPIRFANRECYIASVIPERS